MRDSSVTPNSEGPVIAHIGAGRYRVGGRDHVTFSIWKHLSKGSKRYEVFARSTSKSGTFADEALHVHLLRSVFRREFEFLVSQFLLLPAIIRARPNVIVSQSPVLGGLVAYIASKLLRVPHMTELHSDEFLAAGGGRISRFTALRLLARPVYRHSSAIRVLSETMRTQLVLRLGGEFEDRIFVVGPRVDRKIFRPKVDWRIDGALRIAMLGSVIKRKGQVRAITSLQNAGIDVEFVIIGSGPDEQLCKRYADKGDPRVAVRLLGLLPPEQVAQQLKSCDVFLMNSLSEGTPRAIVEAMAVALPVVSTTAGFCSDLVEHGVTGLLIPPGENTTELLAALRLLLNDEDFRTRVGTAAATMAAQLWDSEVGFQRYREHIWNLADSNHP